MTATLSEVAEEQIGHKPRRMMSQTWKAVPNKLSMSSFRSSRKSVKIIQKHDNPRTFLSYAFIWTAPTMCGFLARVNDIDFDNLSDGPSLWLSDTGDQDSQIISATSRTKSGMFLSLLRHLGSRSRQDFQRKLVLHLKYLPLWRSTVKSAKETSFYLEDTNSTVCLLENTKYGHSLRRERFCELSAVNVYSFDFRPEGHDDNVARAATVAEKERISCAAMIALLEMQDEYSAQMVGNGTCSEEKKLARLQVDIMALYDDRPGCRRVFGT